MRIDHDRCKNRVRSRSELRRTSPVLKKRSLYLVRCCVRASGIGGHSRRHFAAQDARQSYNPKRSRNGLADEDIIAEVEQKQSYTREQRAVR